MRIRSFLFLAVVLAWCAAAPALAQNALHVQSPGQKAADWTVDQIKAKLADQIKPVQYNSKGAMHTFHCVPLAAFLTAAGVPTDFAMKSGADPKTKNPQMRMAVLVRGRDGYGVVFSLAEVLPMVGHREVWLALDIDGQPLADSDGPTRLIVPDDDMPARGVHELASIEVIDLSATAP